MFFLILIIGFNLRFALIGGIGLGTATAFHMQRISHGLPETRKFLFLIGLIRGVSIFWAMTFVMSLTASIVVGCGLFLISFIAPQYNLSPKLWYRPGLKPIITFSKVFLSALIGCSIAGMLALGEFLGHDRLSFYSIGKTAAVISLSIMTVTDFWTSNRMVCRQRPR